MKNIDHENSLIGVPDIQDRFISSYWAAGNAALRYGDFKNALHLYQKAKAFMPELADLIELNIHLIRRRLGNKQFLQIKAKEERIDIVVPVFNALDDVKNCLYSLERNTDGFNVCVIVVNDGSDAITSKWLRKHCENNPLFKLIEHLVNQGYTKAVNTGLRASNAPYVITQNSDTIVSTGWLRGLVNCMESDPRLGIVGPLSNAASWQNVPFLKDSSGSFAVNELPENLGVGGMAQLVAEVSERCYPRLPFVNGFCFMIRRAVIDTIGYMDEENFPVGYGEENDFCIRAMDAGFELAIADDVYVFHAKSKSFGHERRKELSIQGTEALKRKHSPEKYLTHITEVKQSDVLNQVRFRVQATFDAWLTSKPVSLMSMRIMFLLPVKGGGGGAHSVVQEVTEMRRLGISAQVAVKHEQVNSFLKMYTDIPDVQEVFVGFNEQTLLEVADDYDIVVGTIFSSMNLVKRIVERQPHILPAYYVQDYEPLFFEENSPKWQEARDSYTMVAGASLFAKTQWIIDEVKRHHGVTVHKVQPSIDHKVYKPAPRSQDGRLHVTAMIRPQTPRRGAERTMRLLSRLYQVHGERLSIHIFGCDSASPDLKRLERNFPFQNHGLLLRPQVATLLAQSDLFIDLSDYQAFGRTALEAMACGCAAVVPATGGAHEYAQHNHNALIIDTLDEAHCFDSVSCLLASPDQLLRLQCAGMQTAARYSVHAAAISECILMEEQLKAWRLIHPNINKPLLFLMPSLTRLGTPTGSGYVRAVLPYQSPAVLRHWRVKQTVALPEPGSAQVVLIQREGSGYSYSLSELKNWFPYWKAAGGKLIFEVDDDLLDAEGLTSRHYEGDVNETINKVRYLASNADWVHVSSEQLAKLFGSFNKNIRVIPNALDAELWQLDRFRHHDQGPYRRQPNGPVRIGYIGTPTHDQDLELISEAMKVIKKRYGDTVEIEVIGAFQNSPPLFGKRVGLPKKNDYPNFVRWLQERVHWDIGIIPLADNKFNKSKSYLKFLEYAALDMAIVVSDAPSYRPVAKHGHNCLMAGVSIQDWVEKLMLLIEDGDFRKKIAANARNECAAMHTLENVASQLSETLNSFVACAKSIRYSS